MVDLDKAEFGMQLTHFGLVHKTNVTPALVRAYWDDLSRMTRLDFDRACAELRRSNQWFPKPSEFFKAARKGWT